MALANTTQAIGAVTRLLIEHLNRRTGLPITSGRPEEAAGGQTRALNIFLYETPFDASLKNHPLSAGQHPPLWLVLKYLITGFDDTGASDTADAHDVLGQGMSALQELSFLGLDGAVSLNVRRALEDNPEQLKITFDDCTVDLINKVTQASDDEYRICAAFQVRPVMIVPPVPPAFSLLVGIDYTLTPLGLTPAPVGLDVLPSIGPRIGDVEPGKFAIGDEFEITGEDLQVSNLECWLGPTELGVTSQRTDRLTVRVPTALQSGSVISAGEHPLVLKQYLPATGRYRPSNLVVGALLPTVTAVVAAGLAIDLSGFMSGTLTVSGFLLGKPEDAILLALYRDGAVAHLFEIVKTPPPPPDLQQQLVLTLAATSRVLSGRYQVMLIVNGQQARQSPNVDLVA